MTLQAVTASLWPGVNEQQQRLVNVENFISPAHGA